MPSLKPLLLALLAAAVAAVDRSKFHTCAQTGFCKAHRRQPVPHALGLANGRLDGEGVFRADVTGAEGPLALAIEFFANGAARVRVNEAEKPRWEYAGLVKEEMARAAPSQSGNTFSWGAEGSVLTVAESPFAVELAVAGRPAVRFEELHFDLAHERAAVDHAREAAAEADKHHGKVIVDYGEDGRAIYEDGSVEEATEEEAQHDAADEDDSETLTGRISFPGAAQLYGLPEHASSLALKTDYADPYRLYNLDVFEYEMDSEMALYGAIPFVESHSAAGTHGALWLNPSETWVDVERRAGDMSTHWMSEAGVIDVLLFPGSSPRAVAQQLAEATGFAPLPPQFALSYHQCRWNYRDQADVAEVDSKFEEHNIPYDVLWLDIEHTDGKRYFTWDKHLFPEPERMQEDLAAHGRKMVTIVDPHMKRDKNYFIHSEATAKGLYVKDSSGTKDYEGWCWPGSSSWLDFTAAHVRQWWGEQFGYDKYKGSTSTLYTWNDMNEMSVFNGPEVTMPKDTKNLEGVESREWHQLYGMLQQSATADGLVARNEDQNTRPFVLSRAFFAGSQQYGAIWTGDNAAEWSHLEASLPMLMSIGLGGLGFAGADVGGFFGDPTPELLTRWYQVGAFQPFFRGHAHHDSKRREPYVMGEPHTARLRKAIMARYANLPLTYTLFEEHSRTGMPIMRPMWMEFPADEATFTMDDQFMVGGALLVKPVSQPGVTSLPVYLPGPEAWYDLETQERVEGGRTPTLAAPIDKIPVLQRAGTVVPQQRRLRRSSALMHADPFTLVVALTAAGEARGELYLDDYESFDYTRGDFMHRAFTFANGQLSAAAVRASPSGWEGFGNTVERIVVAGLAQPPVSVTVGGQQLGFAVDEATGAVTVRKPGVKVGEDWVISFH